MKIKKTHLNQLIQEEILKIKSKNLLNESHIDNEKEDFTKYIVNIAKNSNDLLEGLEKGELTPNEVAEIASARYISLTVDKLNRKLVSEEFISSVVSKLGSIKG
jgi:hypothetical protein